MAFLINNLNFVPLAFKGVAWLAAAFCYVRYSRRLPRCTRVLVWLAVAFYILFAILESGSQYWVWSQGEPGKFLLPPYQPLASFLRYAFTHFWLAFLIGAGLSLTLYFFLRLLAGARPWLFLDGEAELGLLAGLLAGWPGFVIFLPLVFIIMLPLSLLRQLVLKEERTTMGAAFLMAAAIALIFGNYLIGWLGLGVLRI